MAGERPPDRMSGRVCRWRTSAETLALIEALQRIEALLVRLDDRVRGLAAVTGQAEEVPR